jgi:hypothetical protein
MATTRTNWQDRKHAAHVRTRYASAGWEFDTASDAREYVSDQYAKESPANRANTPFQFCVQSNGAQFDGWHGTQEMDIRSTTYRSGATMRDTSPVPSPSDCLWIVPGTQA